MIHYQLCCSADHPFDGWFRDSAAYQAQAGSGLVSCPACGDTAVRLALMAPAIGRKGSVRQAAAEPGPEIASQPIAKSAPEPAAPPAEKLGAELPDQVRAVLQRIRAEVERSSDYVGPAFADEARRIHNGETERRSIYGESSQEEAQALVDDGIAFARIPWVKPADG